MATLPRALTGYELVKGLASQTRYEHVNIIWFILPGEQTTQALKDRDPNGRGWTWNGVVTLMLPVVHLLEEEG